MKNTPQFISAETLHKKWMKDPEYRLEYEKLEPEFAIIQALIDARVKKKLSQEELAKRMGTGQAAISRLENANANPSLSLMKRLAHAIGMKLKIEFVP